ncbi:hypothetical protein D3C85_1598910 [compost metagenome]
MLPLGEQVAVVAVFEARQPGGAFGGGQAVEDGDGDCHIALQVAQHGGCAALVTFVELRAEGQGMGQQQAGQENQRQPRGQRARPAQPAIHACAPRISTGMENT